MIEKLKAAIKKRKTRHIYNETRFKRREEFYAAMEDKAILELIEQLEKEENGNDTEDFSRD